jgi:DNA-binding transcriptional MerR regulator
MNEPSNYLPPQAVAKELGISPATLRRWSDEFADYLSRRVDTDKGKSHRRYTNLDMAALITIKELMNGGMTYEQVRQQLASRTTTAAANPYRPQPGVVISAEDAAESSEQPSYLPDLAGSTALVNANGVEASTIAFITNSLIALSDSHKSILNSQAANRELMGVLIQDNFNLKEENSRLRERIMDLERNTAQAHRDEQWRREALRREVDAKISTIHQVATQALSAAHSVEMPEIKAVNTKPGCLGAIFGGGGTQIIAMPRRNRQAKDVAHAPNLPPLPEQPPLSHPKPMAPPE